MKDFYTSHRSKQRPCTDFQWNDRKMLWYCAVNIHMFVQIFRSIHFVIPSWVYRATVPFSTWNLSDRTNIILAGSGCALRPIATMLWKRYGPYCQKARMAPCAILPQCPGGAARPVTRVFWWKMCSITRRLRCSGGAARPVISAFWFRNAYKSFKAFRQAKRLLCYLSLKPCKRYLFKRTRRTGRQSFDIESINNVVLISSFDFTPDS